MKSLITTASIAEQYSRSFNSKAIKLLTGKMFKTRRIVFDAQSLRNFRNKNHISSGVYPTRLLNTRSAKSKHSEINSKLSGVSSRQIKARNKPRSKQSRFNDKLSQNKIAFLQRRAAKNVKSCFKFLIIIYSHDMYARFPLRYRRSSSFPLALQS